MFSLDRPEQPLKHAVWFHPTGVMGAAGFATHMHPANVTMWVLPPSTRGETVASLESVFYPGGAVPGSTKEVRTSTGIDLLASPGSNFRLFPLDIVSGPAGIFELNQTHVLNRPEKRSSKEWREVEAWPVFNGRQLELEGNVLWVLSTGRLDTLEVSNPRIPVLRGGVGISEDLRGFQLTSNHVWLAAGKDGLMVLDRKPGCRVREQPLSVRPFSTFEASARGGLSAQI